MPRVWPISGGALFRHQIVVTLASLYPLSSWSGGRRSVDTLVSEQCPGDAGCLIGHGDQHDVCRPPRQEPVGPARPRCPSHLFHPSQKPWNFASPPDTLSGMHKIIEILRGPRGAPQRNPCPATAGSCPEKRKRPRPLLRKADRVFWVILSCLWPGWRHALVIVRPETVIGWHRKGFRLFWTWKSRRGKAGPTAGVEGDPPSGPTDVAGEHTVGRTSDPWRAFEAWLFHLPGRRLEIHGPLPIAAIAVVADIPYKSRRLPGVDRFLRGPHGHVPPPVRVHRAPPRAPPDRAFRCHGEPDDGVGRTTDPRGIPVGHGAAAPDLRPGTAHTGNRSARP